MTRYDLNETELRPRTWVYGTRQRMAEAAVLAEEYGPQWSDFATQLGHAADGQLGMTLLSPGAATVLGQELTPDLAHQVAASTYFAQCAANAEVIDPDQNPAKWYQAFIRHLTASGFWSSQQAASLPFETLNQNMQIDEAVAKLLASVATFTGSGQALITQMLNTFNRQQSQKIRILDESIRTAKKVRFLYTVARKVDSDVKLGCAYLQFDMDTVTSTFLGLRFNRQRTEGEAHANGFVLNPVNPDVQTIMFQRVDGLAVNHLMSVPLKP